MQVEELKKEKSDFINAVNDLIIDYELKTKTLITGIDVVRFSSYSLKREQGFNSDENEYTTFNTIKLTLDY